MRIGLMADVRGLAGPLRQALALLREAGAERIACLGSSVEGGPEDEDVLAQLRAADVVVVPSPHDAPSLGDLPVEATVGSLRLSHELPGGSDEVHWLTGAGAPTLLHARELLATGERRAAGDLYWPMAFGLGDAGPWRRMLLGSSTIELGAGAWATCPGSVALSEQSRHGGSVMVVDDAAGSAEIIRFGPSGERLPARRPRILVYCDEFDPHRPDAEILQHCDLVEKDSADAIAADVAQLDPDVVLLDYHLAGSLSGIDALIALRRPDLTLPVPVLTIAGNPADNMSMKAVGALGGLPFVYLKDVLSRTILELRA